MAKETGNHIPSRAQRVPAPFRERIRGADHVIHAGDFDSKGTLVDVRELAAGLTAVTGNTDPRMGLSTVATTEFEGVEFVVTHSTGARHGYERQVANMVEEHAETDTAVGVSGHTHEVLDTTHDGVRVLNPGSATGASPASRTTMLTATVDDGDLTVERHER